MKRLVLVVHGIGEQGAGDTLDNFAGTITNNVEADIESEQVWLREDYEHHDPRKLKTFACHTRQISEPSGNETKMAEVHWADLSKGPTGTISTIIELMSTLLGLGYLARANVREVHDDPAYTQKLRSTPVVADTIEDKLPSLKEIWAMLCARPWQIRVVDFFVLMAHGPNAVLNALLALGVMLSYMLFALAPEEVATWGGPYWAHGIIAASSLVFIIYGYFSRPHNRLRRQFTDTMFIAGFIGLAAVALVMITGQFGDGRNQTDTFNSYIIIMIAFLQLFWLIMLVMAGSLMVDWMLGLRATAKANEDATALERKASAVKSAATVYPQTIASMVVFWLIFSNIFWIMVGKWVSSNDEMKGFMDTHLGAALGLLWVAMLAALGILVAGYVVVRARMAWIKAYKKDHTSAQTLKDHPVNPQPDQPPTPPQTWGSEVPRLLLNSTLGNVISGFLVFMVGCAIYLLIVRFAFNSEDPNALFNLLNQIAGVVAAALGGILILFWPLVGPKLATGLGVGKDVVNYFVDFKPHRTPRQGINQMLRDPDKRLDFWLRNRINDRFFIVLETMKRSFKPDEIYVISHSQGTIISICALSEDKVSKVIGKTPLKLVTMGSPYSHVYRHYFPNMFSFDTVSDDLAKNWVNIYRVDDFVGTHVETREIGKQTFPRNIPVHPAGHTGYWFDQAVLDVIKDEVGLTFPTPVAAPARSARKVAKKGKARAAKVPS